MKTFIDLFAGIGGFRLALETAGLRCVMSSEIDEHACNAYEANFGERPRGDVTQIDVRTVPECDVICGGFPCQSFSVGGGRQGFADPRGNLYFEILRLAVAVRPKVLLLENVPNILSIDGGRVAQTVVRSAHDAGYELHYCNLFASDFGVATARRRVYFVGLRRDLVQRGELDWTPPQPTGDAVYLDDRLDADVDDRLFVADERNIFYRRPPVAPRSLRTVLVGQMTPKFRGRRHWCHQCSRILSGRAVAATFCADTSRSGSGAYHFGDGRVRFLSPTEVKRVMGFPAEHDTGSLPQTYRLCGNAVIPAMVSRVFGQVVERRVRRLLL